MSIEKAAEAMYVQANEEYKGAILWPEINEQGKDRYRAMARAALPHLLEEPTEGEITRAVVKFNESCMQLALNDFVRRRNAPPEPPEPVETHTVMLEHGLGCSVRDRARTTISHVTSLKLDGVDILKWLREFEKPAAPPIDSLKGTK